MTCSLQSKRTQSGLLSSEEHAWLRQALPGNIQPGASPAPVGVGQTCASVLSQFKPLMHWVCLSCVRQRWPADSVGSSLHQWERRRPLLACAAQ